MFYRNRLAADLERWESSGFIDAQTRAAMLADAESRWPRLELGTVISVLAAVLIVLGVITFVAANWQEIPRLWRLALIVAVVSAAYGSAFVAFRASADYLAHAAILIGVGAFGAGIMLISQMYHISGDTSTFLMMWMAAAGITGALLHSKPSLTAAVLLAVIWSYWTRSHSGMGNGYYHLAFLPVAAVLAALMWRERWRTGIYVVTFAVLVWCIGNIFGFAARLDLIVAAGGVLIASAPIFRSRKPEFSFDNLLVGCGLVLGFGGLIYAMLEVAEPSELMKYVMPEQAGIVLVLAIFTALSAELTRQQNRTHYIEALIAMGLAVFALFGLKGAGKLWTATPLYDWILAAIALTGLILAYRTEASNHSRGVFLVVSLLITAELMVIYFKTMGSYLSTSAFFIGCGLLLAGFATTMLLVERRKVVA
jgi:uncharacterized membrane protein